MSKVPFSVTEHGGINPDTESAKLVAQHFSAYQYVYERCKDKSVLEIGHGEGYGSHYLSKVASKVIAVDLFEKNVIAAAEKHKKDNLEFKQMDATDLKLPDESVDIVCSFQVIEHIPQDLLDRYIAEINRVLKKDGKAYLTTLNLRKNKKPGVEYNKSPDHDKEFYPEEYREYLSPKFFNTNILGLFPTIRMKVFERLKKSGIFKYWPDSVNPVTNFYKKISYKDFIWQERMNLDRCIDLLAVCHKS